MQIRHLFILYLLIGSSQIVYGQINKLLLKRKDSFFGLHFDFHASLEDKHIGETFTYGMIDSMLTTIKPDFVQVDCKGHPGISSCPTQVGTHPDSIRKDILKIWREVTAKHGVALYVHYSGVLDGFDIFFLQLVNLICI